MIQNNRNLLKIALAFLVIYIIYFLMLPDRPGYPFVDQSKEQLINAINDEAERLELLPIDKESIVYSDVIANHSLGRYVEKENYSEEELTKLASEVPIYTYQVDNFLYTYDLDITSEKIVKASNIYLKTDGGKFVKEQFGAEFVLDKTDSEVDELSDWTKKETYVAPTSFANIEKVVDLYYSGNAIIAFDFYGLAKDFPMANDEFTEGLMSVFILLFIIGLTIFVTIHLLIKLIKKEVKAFFMPLLLTIIAGVGWLFVSYAFGSNVSGLSLLDSGIMIYLTLATLLIRWQKNDTLSFAEKVADHKKSIFQGLLLTIITVVLAETYFFIAGFLDTWSSPVTSHIVFVQLDYWLLPLFTAFIGLSAAITEEAIFRNYLIPLFRRASHITAIVMSSALWGILHIGYDMYPWYLYVLEFILISGPFFYFVYVKYGFKTVIWMHYFYNAWVTTLLLFYVDLTVALVSLAVMLSPFLLFLVKRNNKDDVNVDVGVEKGF